MRKEAEWVMCEWGTFNHERGTIQHCVRLARLALELLPELEAVAPTDPAPAPDVFDDCVTEVNVLRCAECDKPWNGGDHDCDTWRGMDM